MPSIIPLGATMSAPARAWATACWPSIGSVASLSTSTRPPISHSAPQCPWLVYSQKHTSVITEQLGGRLLDGPDRLGDDPRVAHGVAARWVLLGGNAEQEDPAQPERRAWRTSSASMSGESWKWPGIEAISRRTFSPGPHEQRQDQFRRRSRVSRTRRRTAGMVAQPAQARGGKTGI